MRQIGARDEARLLADYETCGRECCCRTFLKSLKPVSMKMAKMQKATLDPSKVSGRCGRLKCCLRYEHATYEELDGRLPKVGARVRTTQGSGVVTARQILTQLVQITTDTGGRMAIGVEEVLGPDDGTAPPPPESPPRGSGRPRGRGPRSTTKPTPEGAGSPGKPATTRSARGRQHQKDSSANRGGTPRPRRSGGPPPESGSPPASTSSGDTPPAEAENGGENAQKRPRRRRRSRGRRRGGKPGDGQGNAPPPEGPTES